MRWRARRSLCRRWADAVGAVCVALDPLRRLIEAHVMAAERLHGDDTTVPGWQRARPIPDVLGLRSRRQAVRRVGAARGDVLLRAGSAGRASTDPSGELQPASCRPTPTTATTSSICGPKTGTDPGGGVLGPWPPTVLSYGRPWRNARRKATGKKEIPLSPIAIEGRSP